jgi:hypothetical protein
MWRDSWRLPPKYGQIGRVVKIGGLIPILADYDLEPEFLPWATKKEVSLLGALPVACFRGTLLDEFSQFRLDRMRRSSY